MESSIAFLIARGYLLPRERTDFPLLLCIRSRVLSVELSLKGEAMPGFQQEEEEVEPPAVVCGLCKVLLSSVLIH